MCPRGNDKLSGGCTSIVLKGEGKKSIDRSYPRNSAKRSSRQSTISSMSRSSLGKFVYKRRKLHAKSNSNTTIKGIDGSPKDDDCFSSITCNTFMVAPNAPKEKHVALPVEQENKGIKEWPLSSTPKGSIGSKEVVDEIPIVNALRKFEVDNASDSCSSSKSHIDQVTSSNAELDEVGGCSSSNVATMKYMEDLSEKEICIGILRKHGMLFSDCITRSFERDENTISNSNTCFRSCKICRLSETTSKLLICDSCEAAFHLKCNKPRIKIVPSGEWFCETCVRKGCKAERKFSTVNSGLSGNKCLSPNGKTNAIGLMLRNNEPYTTSVRIGKAFQAEVPDWHGALENNDIAEPMELDPSEYLTFHESSPCKTSESDTMNNWLQCQAILDTSENDLQNKTICGKWRRAPLFEVQTDEWECFSSVWWEPRFADCAVPQEITTKEVHRQLKCVEKLRLQLRVEWKDQHDQKKTMI